MGISMGSAASYAYCQHSEKNNISRIPLSMQAGVMSLSTLYFASTDELYNYKFRPGRALLRAGATSALSYSVGFASGAIYSGAARHQDV
jgi:hypothetical protein